MKTLLDLFTDFLSVTYGYATVTGLSGMINGVISHDRITRFLAKETCGIVKPVVREVASDEGALIFNDTIQEKPWISHLLAF